MAVSVQKKISNNKVLAAWSFDDEEIEAKGIAIGVKNRGGMYVDAIVRVQEDENKNKTVVISKEKIEELGCTVVWE